MQWRLHGFGVALRAARVHRDVKQAALAAELGISTVYLWQIEVGQKPPLDPDRTRRAATFLELDPAPLLLAAAFDRGSFPGLPADPADPERAELALRLTEGWSSLTPTQISKLRKLLT